MFFLLNNHNNIRLDLRERKPAQACFLIAPSDWDGFFLLTQGGEKAMRERPRFLVDECSVALQITSQGKFVIYLGENDVTIELTEGKAKEWYRKCDPRSSWVKLMQEVKVFFN